MSHAIITGSAGGLGAAYARELARRGHDLLLLDIRADALEALCRELSDSHGVQARPLTCDLTDRVTIEETAKVLASTEDVAMLVNNAGFGCQGPLVEMSASDQMSMVDIMVSTTVHFCAAVLPAMHARGHGSIINVSSIGAFSPGTDWAIYGAAKRFVLHYTQSLYQELAETDIQVQALCPGFTRTGFHHASGVEDQIDYVPDTLWMTADEVVQASLDGLGGRCVFIPSARHHLHLASNYSGTFRRFLYAALRRVERVTK